MHVYIFDIGQDYENWYGYHWTCFAGDDGCDSEGEFVEDAFKKWLAATDEGIDESEFTRIREVNIKGLAENHLVRQWVLDGKDGKVNVIISLVEIA